MTEYEELISEYEEKLCIEEHKMLSDGLYCNNNIWIKKDLTQCEKVCVLAEEIGHYETSVGNILDLSKTSNSKQELKARRWSFEKLLSMDKILAAAKSGYTEIYDIADYLGVSETFLKEAMKYYGIG